jgi:hypothetical protein
LDEELDEDDYEWDIPRDWNLKYFRRNTIMKTKRADLTVMALENYRKQKGKEGELLIRWKDGRRDWTIAYAAKKDAKAPMYNAALKKFKMTNELLKYNQTNLIAIAVAEQQKKLNLLTQNKKHKGGT